MALCFCLSGSSARAATFNIAVGDVSGLATAITTSNGNGEANVINLSANGVYTLTAAASTSGGAVGLPPVANTGGNGLTINGNGAVISRLNTASDFRLFTVQAGASLDLESVTLTQGLVSGDDSVFEQSSGGAIDVAGTLTANNCTFGHNSASTGGGAIFNVGSVKLNGCTFNTNSATGTGDNQGGGGAIENWGETGDVSIFPTSGGATLHVTGCSFTGNTAGAGAAIWDSAYHGSTTIVIDTSTFSSNAATQFGGAIGTDGSNNGNSSLTITGSSFTSNQARNGGGAVFNHAFGPDGAGAGEADLHLTNCTLDHNSLTGGVNTDEGGAIISSGLLTLTGCTVSNNSSDGIGGGVASGSTLGDIDGTVSTATLTACTINGNSAVFGGGLLSDGRGVTSHMTLVNCTLSGNSATLAGGGVLVATNFPITVGLTPLTTCTGDVSLANCTLAANSAVSGGGIFLSSHLGVGTTTASINNTILKAGASGANIAAGEVADSFTSGGFNLSSDNGGLVLTALGDKTLVDPLLDPAGLADNGGPTKTIKLMAGSPAIDQGNTNLAVDQIGNHRPIDIAASANAVGGNETDIGAFEVQPGVPDKSGPVTTITVPKKNSTVTSLPVLTATASDAGSGVAHVDLYLARNADGMFWNGTVWGVTAAPLASVSSAGGVYTKTGGLPTPTSTDPTTKLADGIYTVYARAYDNLNNLTTASSLFQMQTPIKVSCTITVPKKNSTINGLTGLQAKTTDSLGGTGVKSVDFYLLRNADSKWWSGTAWGAVAAAMPAIQSPSGTWTKTGGLPVATSTDLTKKLTDGIYTLYARPTDTHGVVTTFSSLFQQITPIKVSCTITVPKKNSTVNGLTGFQAKTTDSDGGTGVKSVDFYLLRNADSKWWSGTVWGSAATALPSTQSPSGTWTKTGGLPTPTSTDLTKKLTDGIYTVYARPTDIHGAVTTFSSLFQQQTPITVHATITIPAKNSTVTSLPSLAATTTDSLGGTGVAKVDFYIARSADGKFWSGTAWIATATALPSTKGSSGGTWTKTGGLPAGANLADGIYTVYARPTDIHGVVTTFSSLFQVKTGPSPFIGFWSGTFSITAGSQKNQTGKMFLVIGPDGVAGTVVSLSGKGIDGYCTGTANLSTGSVTLSQLSEALTGSITESIQLSATGGTLTGSGTLSVTDGDVSTGTILMSSKAAVANTSVGIYLGTFQLKSGPGFPDSGTIAFFVDNGGTVSASAEDTDGDDARLSGTANFGAGTFSLTGSGSSDDNAGLGIVASGTFAAPVGATNSTATATYTTTQKDSGTFALTRVAPSP